MSSRGIQVAFIGCWTEHESPLANPAFSQAGTLFQRRLLESLQTAGVEVSHAFCLRPVVSYPVDRQIWFGRRLTRFAGRLPTTLLPFVNLGPLKPLSAGLALLPLLMLWSWRHRGTPRIFLFYNIANPPGFVGILAARLTGAKAVAVMADLQVPGHGLVPDTFLRRLEFLLQVWTLPCFDGLVALTRGITEDFAPRVPFIQLEGAVPDSMADFPTEEEADAAAPGPDGPFILMYAGQLAELKGVPLLLGAFRRLEGEWFRLWITGTGPLRDQVEEAARHDHRITYWGFPPHDEVLELYQQATVLLNPHSTRHRSARYVFPSKLLEYLATGKPVISTCSVPEIAEEYRDVLFLLHEASPEELADLVRRVAAMPEQERAAVGRQGRAFVLERKTWSAQGRRVAAFIRQRYTSSGTRMSRAAAALRSFTNRERSES